MRTKHNYLSLKQHETDAAVKPEVFMASTHLFIPFEAKVFMDGHQDILVHVEIVICCTDRLRDILVHQKRSRDILIAHQERLREQYINTSASKGMEHMPQSNLRCLWQVRMCLCLLRLRYLRMII